MKHTRRHSGPVPESSYRADIQGLRAIAVLLVVFNHVGLGFARGGYVGVDVFFVVSGYLITGLLLRSAAATGRVDFRDFYSRRALRILPAAALTLVVTDIAAWALLNYVRAQDVIQDSISAALFAANIRFEHLGTDYFAAGLPPSPIQHFWSLAVEEQFYLVWPFLLALLWFAPAWFRRFRSRISRLRVGVDHGYEKPDKPDLSAPDARRRVLCALLAVVAFSVAWCVKQTSINPPDAYFSPFTRAWELGLGAALAMAAPLIATAPGRIKALVSWLGLLGIVAAALWFTENTPFPGTAALLPVFSTALVIAGGTGWAGRLGAGDLIGLAPFRFIGDVSYSFYLWHWPFLVIPAAMSSYALSLDVKLALVAVAFATAVITYFFFENPIRRSKRLWGGRPSRARGLVLWPASLIVVVTVSAFGMESLRHVQAREAAMSLPAPPAPVGAAAGSPSSLPATEAKVAAAVDAAERNDPLPRMYPSVADVRKDFFDLPGCFARSGPPTNSEICYLGDPGASRSVVVFGDSHASMWLPALIPIATSEHWKLIPVVKDACWAAAWRSGACGQWYGWALDQIRRESPAVVIIGTCRNACNVPTWRSGIRAAIKSFRAMGAQVIVLGDPPTLDSDSVDCLLTPGATMRTCTFPLAGWKLSLNKESAEAVQSAGAAYLEVQAWLCAKELCPDVIGDVIVYRDNNHLTRAYVEQLTQPMAESLDLNG